MVRCAGWWEQDGLGRQMMEPLQVRFEDDHLVGAGTDVIGDFTLRGVIRDSTVTIVKQYVGAHSVDYPGTFDGEGTLQGLWSIHGIGGRWLIKVVASEAGSTEIVDL